MVYPSGLEPELDGVGGRNVIQLHYGYFSLPFPFSVPKIRPLQDQELESIAIIP